METVNLIVNGMTCVACVKHVEKAINSITGVVKVEVDLASGAVKVEGNVLHHGHGVGQGFNAEGVHGAHLLHNLEKTVDLGKHALTLIGGELKSRQVGDALDLGSVQ
jgi:copper chaperone CopZ